MFSLPKRVQHLLIFIYSSENFLIVNFINQLIYSILLHVYISKACNLHLSSVCRLNPVFAASFLHYYYHYYFPFGLCTSPSSFSH